MKLSEYTLYNEYYCFGFTINPHWRNENEMIVDEINLYSLDQLQNISQLREEIREVEDKAYLALVQRSENCNFRSSEFEIHDMISKFESSLELVLKSNVPIESALPGVIKV